MNRKEIPQYLINEDATLLEAIKRLEGLSNKILFILRDGKLAASLTDGDVRRWLLKSRSVEAKVIDASNPDPHYLLDVNAENAVQTLKEWKINALPIVNKDGKVVDIQFANPSCAISSKALTPIPVVIMAGGLGTRLYPYTKILPKPLIPIGELSITEHIIQLFQQFGCQTYYLVVNHKRNMIKAYFNELDKDYSLLFIDEDEPLGTGGGVGLLRDELHGTFILTNCDTLIQEDFGSILEEHQKKENAITMICTLKDYTIPYGVVDMDENGSIAAMQEKPKFSFFTNTGTYIVEPSIMELISENESIGFPDIIKRAQEKNMRIGVFPISEDNWLDMGQFGELDKMKRRLGIDE